MQVVCHSHSGARIRHLRLEMCRIYAEYWRTSTKRNRKAGWNEVLSDRNVLAIAVDNG
jgi:hypothetical protein